MGVVQAKFKTVSKLYTSQPDMKYVFALLSHLPPLPPGEGWGEGIKSSQLPVLYPLILSFSRREKGRSTLTAVIHFQVGTFSDNR
jgi:hypothetical protein